LKVLGNRRTTVGTTKGKILRGHYSGDSRMEKIGGPLRGQGKSRGQHKYLSMHGDFSLF